MVERGAHIDLFFRNGLKEYEVLPPSDVWENIKPAIAQKQRPLIILKSAATLAILVSMGAVFFFLARNLSDKIISPALSLNQETIPEGSYVAKTRQAPVIISKETPVIAEETIKENAASGAPEKEVYSVLPVAGLFKSQLLPGSLRDNNLRDLFRNPILTDAQSPAASKIDFKPEGTEISESPRVGSRWSIGALASPAYYSKFDFDKNDASKDLIKSEKAAASYSGGIAFSYLVNKRLSVQTGLYYSSLGQKVTGVSSFAGFHDFFDVKTGSDFIVKTSSGIITSYNNDIYLKDNLSGSRVITRYTADVFDPYKSNLQYIDNSILQNFNYLEIPFLLRYKIIDRKIDIDLMGGLSYNLLVNNTVYSVSGGVKYYIGKTEGLSPVTFSSSLGVGMEYSLSKRLSLNLEPNFRYYITPLGGLAGSSIHQYSFGILSGFFYKF